LLRKALLLLFFEVDIIMEESENPWVWVREFRIRDWGIGIRCREEMDEEVDVSNSNSDSGDEVKSSGSTAPSSRLEEETEDAKQRVNLRIREKWLFPSVPRLMEGNTGGQLGKLKDPLQRTAIRRGKTLEYVLDGIGRIRLGLWRISLGVLMEVV
jgi:hypothetical protein